jgi:hydrogenase maturation protease
VTDRVLVIGYGNSLRTDDGVGRYAAERLADDPRLAAATVVHVHQLAPELAVDVSRADLLVLIDASRGPDPGTIRIAPVERTNRAAMAWTHHLDPASLVALAEELYGHAPQAYVVSVAVESVEVGDRLSPSVEATVPRVVDAIAAFVTARAGVAPGEANHA